ncbi:unnamed protein product [Chondrus crispus]|uniref:Double-strand break repair protein n=1 Tax=Chondrus crispus TaxID=2769 RepID=R7QAV2_CHOCR|nr:unnamed protein product [Chondrus crispus]CDF35204.1 unnamed protein product [Chondrus crispus]|eukprot:XP_005715023.1 unnamed protein product [Chondrus crispus]
MHSARTELVPSSSDVIKILISTDNHLGYLEKDPVRGDDSFRVFEEVLQLATVNKVDMLLLGGDLFHDNKPSRSTILKTMRLLRQHCLSPDGEIHLAVRSDPAAVNYMDPCVAVSLPVFVIHGNHDDPTGGTGLEALSSLDLLAQAGLITYFGRAVSSKKVEVAPILLQKGQTALALYGLGNVRDEVLYDTWARQKRVKWLSPEQPANLQAERHLDVEGSDRDGDERSDHVPWFNLFVLHQNRLTRGSSRGISDTLLPPWLDYVVWGHEHDSIPDLTLSKPPIVQPGSTVATSLSAGEAKPKHAILLEVYKGKLKHRSVPLYTVRNLHFEDIVLSEQSGLSETDPEGLNKFLEDSINDVVERQETLFDHKVATFQGGTSKEVVHGVRYPPRSFYTDKLNSIVRQPLIRLRVEITGNWESPNPIRFGQAYVGRVASAADMLLFYRSKRGLRKKTRTFLQGNASAMVSEDEEDGPGNVPLSQTDDDGRDVIHIPKLVQYFLYHRQGGGSGLKFLELDKLTGAVDQFVNKMENQAIPDYVQSYMAVQLKKTLKEANNGGETLDESELLERFKKEANAAVTRTLVESQPQKVKDGKADATKGIDAGSEKCLAKDEVETGDGVKEKKEMHSTIQERLEDVHAVLAGHPTLLATLERTGRIASDDDGDSGKKTPSKRSARSTGRETSRVRGSARSKLTTSRRTATARKPPPREANPRRASRVDSMVIEDSDEEQIEAANKQIVLSESEEEYVPVPSTRKRRPRASASGSRSASRSRLEQAPTSQPRRSAFAMRARARRNTATIDLDEESGDDAM